ncbi:MAG: hypothetical protein ACXAC8_05970 [Candidatus Hodarchaeales archaeon]|jgi:hypothetical protein
MSQISFFLVPEFKNQISHGTMRNSLDLVESIIGFSKGNSLNQDNIDRITIQLGKRMKGTRLYPGGSSVLFGWSFFFKNIGNVIIKPYYKRRMTALLIHYLTVKDSQNKLQNRQLRITSRKFSLKIPDVIGFAKIETFSQSFPALITFEVLGESIHKRPALIKIISRLSRDLAKNGIIVDPYPSNWKYNPANNARSIHYIDLLSSNRLIDARKRIAELIQNIE